MVHEEVTAQNQVVLPRPGSGWYYLRIAVIDISGQQAPFGPAQRISVPIADFSPLIIFTVLGIILAL